MKINAFDIISSRINKMKTLVIHHRRPIQFVELSIAISRRVHRSRWDRLSEFMSHSLNFKVTKSKQVLLLEVERGWCGNEMKMKTLSSLWRSLCWGRAIIFRFELCGCQNATERMWIRTAGHRYATGLQFKLNGKWVLFISFANSGI